MKKLLVLVMLLFSAAFLFTACDTDGVNPTSPVKEDIASTPGPVEVPTAWATVLAENGDAAVNTEYTYSTDSSDGSVDWDVTTQTAGHIQGIGEHAGELKWLDIDIIFQSPYFYTAEGYAGYYIGLPMNYEIHITNMGNRKYEHLDVAAVQEYYETGTCDRWWYPDPQIVDYTKGEAMPGDSMMYWRDVSVSAGEELVLKGTYTAPLATCSGLDRIALAIQHTNNGATHAATMYYNPEAAVYCPPPPSENP
ncbi:MAG: hypothetical protein LLG37_11105 [Spirochaetia bacterium]|nr:hypothetical protein [Spirochaetia bacterium]